MVGGNLWEGLGGGDTSLDYLDGRQQWKRGGSPLEVRREEKGAKGLWPFWREAAMKRGAASVWCDGG